MQAQHEMINTKSMKMCKSRTDGALIKSMHTHIKPVSVIVLCILGRIQFQNDFQKKHVTKKLHQK